MSQEKADFDLVYDEVCSQVGIPNTATEAVTTVAAQPDFSCLADGRHRIVRHPYADTWLEADYREIGRVRRLGRFLIDDTKHRIGESGNFESFKQSSDLVSIYEQFYSRDWYDAHPEVEHDEEHGRKPDVALPERIAALPNGDYVNCLGVSIGLSALAELAGLEYLYASELRDDGQVLTRNFRGINDKIKKVLPEAFELDSLAFRTIQIYDLTEASGSKKRYAGMPIVNPAVFENQGEIPLRDYHHFIIAQMPLSESDPINVQVDPYNLIFKQYDLTHTQGELIRNVLAGTGDTAIVTSQTTQTTYRLLNECLDKILALTVSADGLYEKDQFESIRDAITVCLGEIIGVRTGSDDLDGLASFFMSNTVISQHLELATFMGLDSERKQLLECIRNKDRAGTGVTLDNIANKFKKRNRYDTKLRRFNLNLTRQYPVAIFMQLHRIVIESWFAARESGPPNSAAEVAEPDFMIGAMYLNHYANNRKDGRINIARYLSRYTSSQLIWLAAQSDGESEEDPSLQAVGDFVRSLTPAEMHPRVHLVVKH